MTNATPSPGTDTGLPDATPAQPCLVDLRHRATRLAGLLHAAAYLHAETAADQLTRQASGRVSEGIDSILFTAEALSEALLRDLDTLELPATLSKKALHADDCAKGGAA